MVAGKLISRFQIGLGQKILLFGAGWVLFGISIGRSSWALLFLVAAISFAAAAFSVVIACGGNPRDALLPIGAMAARLQCRQLADVAARLRALLDARTCAWHAHDMDHGGVQQPDDSQTPSVKYSVACGGYVCDRCGLSRSGNC